jgi:hypothetical protein
MARNEDSPVTLYGTVEARTARALLVAFTLSGDQAWVPRSQILEERQLEDGTWAITVKAWLANKNGWM